MISQHLQCINSSVYMIEGGFTVIKVFCLLSEPHLTTSHLQGTSDQVTTSRDSAPWHLRGRVPLHRDLVRGSSRLAVVKGVDVV